MEKKETIITINEDIIRSIAKKVITYTSSENMPFNELVFSRSKAGYGFQIQDEGKFMSVRSHGKKLMVHITNSASGYKKNFTISEASRPELKTKTSVDSYKKYCVNTAYIIYKTWAETPKHKAPDLGDEVLYKY